MKTFYLFLTDLEKYKTGYIIIKAPDYAFAFERLSHLYEKHSILLSTVINPDEYTSGDYGTLIFNQMKYAVAISQSLTGKPLANKVFVVEASNMKQAVAEAIAEDHIFYQSQYSAEDWPNRKQKLIDGLITNWNESTIEAIILYYQNQKRFISKPVKIS